MADIRTLDRAEDLLTAGNVFRAAMVGLPFPPLETSQLADIFEPGRTYGAFVDGHLVGTTDSYSGGLVVPGGKRLSHAAVTHVGVLPTHTRRGLASALAARQLADARRQGDVVATLRASDARIYGHFGYGVASSSVSFEVDREKARLRSGVSVHGEVRLVDAAASWDLFARIYSDHTPQRTGTIERSPYWWSFQKYKQSLSRMPIHAAVHGQPGLEDGFVRYHPTGLDDWFFGSQRTIVVDDLIARTPAAYVALVRHLLSVDLVHRIVFASRPADDPLPWLLEDHRAARVTAVRDETWLRLLDVETALAARSYAADDAVTLAVEDGLLPENSRTIRLSRSSVSATNARPEASIDVSALAAAYLGGAKWWQLAQAGRVRTESPVILGRLDALFAVDTAPHSGTMF